MNVEIEYDETIICPYCFKTDVFHVSKIIKSCNHCFKNFNVTYKVGEYNRTS